MEDNLDWEKLEEVALAVLSLTMHTDRGGTRAWKGLDWQLTDRLHERGWISDPQSKAKSVALTDEGVRLATEFLQKHFAKA